MKKIFFLLVLFFIFVSAVTIYADEIRVTIDGREVNFEGQNPVIVDGRTLIPVRGVFEELGFEGSMERR
jgi:hypothetical protein